MLTCEYLRGKVFSFQKEPGKPGQKAPTKLINNLGMATIFLSWALVPLQSYFWNGSCPIGGGDYGLDYRLDAPKRHRFVAQAGSSNLSFCASCYIQRSRPLVPSIAQILVSAVSGKGFSLLLASSSGVRGNRPLLNSPTNTGNLY